MLRQASRVFCAAFRVLLPAERHASLVAAAWVAVLHAGLLWLLFHGYFDPPPVQEDDAPTRLALIVAPSAPATPPAPSSDKKSEIVELHDQSKPAMRGDAERLVASPSKAPVRNAEVGDLQAAREQSPAVTRNGTSATYQLGESDSRPLASASSPVRSASDALPPSQERRSDSADSWVGKVIAHLEKHRRYPHAAKLRKQESVVHLRVRISRQGQLELLELATPSGFPFLDQAALDTFRRAQPLPPVPEDLAAPQDLIIPVEFLLHAY